MVITGSHDKRQKQRKKGEGKQKIKTKAPTGRGGDEGKASDQKRLEGHPKRKKKEKKEKDLPKLSETHRAKKRMGDLEATR